MQVLDTIGLFRQERRRLRGRVGVVPTMGALHPGHLSLVEAARAENDHVIATIFVNPLQFAASEDLDKYPRTLGADLELFERAGVDIVFTPAPDVMYPPGFQTSVMVREVSRGLEGDRRPGHFEGVATVVAKLLNITQPDIAYFGQKDAQQVVVIKRMVNDLDLPVEIAVCPTVRESNGLAMSSRNIYLTPDMRARAGTIYTGLRAAADAFEHGVRRPDQLIDTVIRAFAPDLQVEYVSLNHPVTLQPYRDNLEPPVLLSTAVRMASTRLIDNVLLPLSLNNRVDLSKILGG